MKMAINIALETKSDNELIRLLKDFISSKKNHNEDNFEENVPTENNENIQNDNRIVPLRQHLIPQITNPHVTKIRGAPCKKRIKGAMEISKGKR